MTDGLTLNFALERVFGWVSCLLTCDLEAKLVVIWLRISILRPMYYYVGFYLTLSFFSLRTGHVSTVILMILGFELRYPYDICW